MPPENGGFDKKEWEYFQTRTFKTGRPIVDDSLTNTIETSDEESTQDRRCKEGPVPSIEQGLESLAAETKYQLLVLLMREVYAKFDYHSTSSFRGHAGDQSKDSAGPVRRSNSQQTSQNPNLKTGKRARSERDSSPPDNNGGKRGRPNKLSSTNSNSKQWFACPCFKRDPGKYCTNSFTGILYRTCSTTRFRNVSDVK